MILSIDRSLSSASVALFDEGCCLGAIATPPSTPATRNTAPWECALDKLLAQTQTSLEQIERFVVGLGPGSFSGIRSSLALLKGLALPRACPIVGFPSAMAIAQEMFATNPEIEHLFIVGDARRDTVWLAEYSRDFSTASLECLPSSEALTRIQTKPQTLIVSPDAARLAPLALPLLAFPCENSRPLAQALGEVALLAPSRCIDPPLPLYLHPAVRPAK